MESTPLPVVVGALINENDEVLLMKRGNPPFEGQWVLPGGKWERGESLRDALLREVCEETSYKIEDTELVAVVSVRIVDEKENLIDHYILFFHVCYVGKGERDEDSCQFFDKESLERIQVAPVDRKLIELCFSSQNRLWVGETVVQKVQLTTSTYSYALREFHTQVKVCQR